MPRKNNPLDLTAPLVPHFFYRRHGPVAKGVIGLEDTQIDEHIKSGELPPPVKAFESGRASGWFGWQLIELQQRRLAQAEVGAVTEPSRAKFTNDKEISAAV
jgi:predicted DNA-binding transcriptional regulator AlpA